MIYTLGHRESYLTALKEGPVTKIGPRAAGDVSIDPYPGGCAFLTVSDAAIVLSAYGFEDWSVFLMEGTPYDTYLHDDTGERHICKDLRVVNEVPW